ncbi:MAG: anti-sigma factor family protein, partial [Gemmatimonadaceae bacterium]
MQHLDEGTIHSWIDRQVDAEQAREIEAHLAQCAMCSAAVAEARGFVAASSRILTALDDVPGGVVPKRAVPPVARPARRQWRAAPWVTGIAAALVLAIGLNQLDRNEPAAMLDQELSDVRREAARQALQTVPVTDSVAVAPPTHAPPTQLITNQVARPRPVPPQSLQPPRVLAARSDSGLSRARDASAVVAADMAAPGAAAGAQQQKVAAAPAPAAVAP